MLILSAGMQKSGSAYLYNLLNGLLVAAGQQDSRGIRARHPLESLLRGRNNHFLGPLRLWRLLKLWHLTRGDGPLLVKTHEPPTAGLKLLQAGGAARVIYLYRDPRDALLSAMDYGAKFRAAGEADHPFAALAEFDAALAAVKRWLIICGQYRQLNGALILRYEDLMAGPLEILQACEQHLGITVSAEARDAVLWANHRENASADRRGSHLNKARTFRYRTEMSPEQQARCLEEFGDTLEPLGYSRE